MFEGVKRNPSRTSLGGSTPSFLVPCSLTQGCRAPPGTTVAEGQSRPLSGSPAPRVCISHSLTSPLENCSSWRRLARRWTEVNPGVREREAPAGSGLCSSPFLPWLTPLLCWALTLPPPSHACLHSAAIQGPPPERADRGGREVPSPGGPGAQHNAPLCSLRALLPGPAARAALPQPLFSISFPVDLVITVQGWGGGDLEARPGTESERAGAPGPASAVVTFPLRGPGALPGALPRQG